MTEAVVNEAKMNDRVDSNMDSNIDRNGIEANKGSNGGKRVLIIEGVRDNGTKFRPSDWPERVSGMFSKFGEDHRLHYADGVKPRVVNGQRVLTVETSLQERDPDVYHTVVKFARDNNLRTREEHLLE